MGDLLEPPGFSREEYPKNENATSIGIILSTLNEQLGQNQVKQNPQQSL